MVRFAWSTSVINFAPIAPTKSAGALVRGKPRPLRELISLNIFVDYYCSPKANKDQD